MIQDFFIILQELISENWQTLLFASIVWVLLWMVQVALEGITVRLVGIFIKLGVVFFRITKGIKKISSSLLRGNGTSIEVNSEDVVSLTKDIETAISRIDRIPRILPLSMLVTSGKAIGKTNEYLLKENYRLEFDHALINMLSRDINNRIIAYHFINEYSGISEPDLVDFFADRLKRMQEPDAIAVLYGLLNRINDKETFKPIIAELATNKYINEKSESFKQVLKEIDSMD